MSSKQHILKAVRAQLLEAVDMPSLDQAWIKYDDSWSQFRTLLESVGGRFVQVASAEEIPSELAAAPTFASASSIVSTIPSVPGTLDLNTVDDPHTLESVDWAVLPAQFAVAENGALWVTDQAIKHRAIYFIVQHLSLVVSASQIVHNMHEAYQRITLGQSSLGVFVSGPSKTADIEQSLVIGAHGPRSLTVFCVEAS